MLVAMKERKSLQTKGHLEKANAQDVFSIPELKSSALNHSSLHMYTFNVTQ